MPMRRELYPRYWERIAHACKSEMGWRCEMCGMQLRRPGEPFDTHRRTATVAHMDHDPSNCDPDNLRCLCPACHLRYDAVQHAESRRRNKQKGQTALFD